MLGLSLIFWKLPFRISRRLVGVSLAAAAITLLAPARARAQVPPDERWRTIQTEHFNITYPERLDSLGRLAAVRAEQAWAGLSSRLTAPPRGRTEVLISDHVDFSNGFARVAPLRQAVAYAHPPVDEPGLSFFDEWLEVVVTHELAHLFHLDAGGKLSRALRGVFGSVPSGWPIYPQQDVPTWVIEGLATWYESALTGEGRILGTEQEMTLRTAVLEGAFEDLGQASGESPVWPGGSRAYIYGAHFFDYLLETYGEGRMRIFVDAMGGRVIPYLLIDQAAQRAFGVSFSRAWRDWSAQMTQEVEAFRESEARRGPITVPEAITTGSRSALYPLVARDGGVLFSLLDGKSDSQLRRTGADGSGSEQLTRTNGQATFDLLPDGGVLLAQFEVAGPYRIYSDLTLRAPDGDERRVTREARVEHPAVAPDGRVAVAVQFDGMSNRLVEVDLASGAVEPLAVTDASALWAYPRVSPNGRWIAVSRWHPGALFDVVILDRSGRMVSEVTHDRAVDTAPAWAPDGSALVWSSDRTGVRNLFAAQVSPETGVAGPVRQVTHVLTGAAWPSVDPSGRWIYFSAYHADGWDIARVPFDPAMWFEPFPTHARFAPTTAAAPPALPAAPSAPYSSLRTLRPRYWDPKATEAVRVRGRELVGPSLGILLHGQDLVARHTFHLRTLVATTGQFDGSLEYRWAGLGNPVLDFFVGQGWSGDALTASRSDGGVDSLFTRERERTASGSVSLRIPGFRKAASISAGGGLVWESRTLLDATLEPTSTYRLRESDSRLADLRASLSFSTVRTYAFNVGPSNGVSALLQGRRRRHLSLADSLVGLASADRGFDEGIGRMNVYRSIGGPGFAKHVLAARVAGGVASGAAASASHFRVGGASGSPEPVSGFELFGGSSFTFPVRGYENGTRGGRFAWSAAAEYRFPVAIVHEGLGLFPLHVDDVSGSLFFDAGNAWGGRGEENPARGAIYSVGAEAMAGFLAAFNSSFTLRLGAALPLVGTRTPVAYVRIGRPF